MEFKNGAVQNQTTSTSYPLPTVTYLPGSSLQGGFPDNVSTSRVFQTPVSVTVPVNVEEAMQRELEKEQIRRELEKEEIRREIIASEMALARRRELEEEVRREMASERALRIPMLRPEGLSVRQRVSMPLNQRMNNRPVNNINIFGGPQPQLPPQVDIRQPYTQTWTQTQTQTHTTNTNNKDKVIILTKPDAHFNGAKRKAITPPAVDSEHSSFTLQKKSKQDWSCSLCQIATTSEKGLKDHLQGKKHKAKEESLRTKKIGLDARPEDR